MRKGIFIAVGFSLVSGAVGVVAGYHLAIRRLNEEYNLKMEEEIERTRNYYAQRERFNTPQEAVEELISEEEVLTDSEYKRVITKLQYNAVEDGVAPEMKFDPRQNVFNGATTEDETFETEVARRDTSRPYIISHIENDKNVEEYDQVTLTYYEADGILADGKDEVYDVKYVGEANLKFGHRSNDPNVVYIQNDKLTAKFEVLRSTGSFAHEVHGLGEKAG